MQAAFIVRLPSENNFCLRLYFYIGQRFDIKEEIFPAAAFDVQRVAAEHDFAVADEVNVVLPAGVAAVAIFGIDADAHGIRRVVGQPLGFEVLVNAQVFPGWGEAGDFGGIGVNQGFCKVAFDDGLVVVGIAAEIFVAQFAHVQNGGFGNGNAACKQGGAAY